VCSNAWLRPWDSLAFLACPRRAGAVLACAEPRQAGSDLLALGTSTILKDLGFVIELHCSYENNKTFAPFILYYFIFFF